MSENVSETGKKETLSLTKEPSRRLELRKGGESSQVKQSFSHGRTKTVQVEVRKKRSFARGAQPAEPETPKAPEPAQPAPAPAAAPAPEASAEDDGQKVRHVLPTLSEAEKKTRARALESARAADEEARKRAEEDGRRRAEEEARMAAEREAAEARRREEEERKRVEDEARRKAEEEAQRRLNETPEEEAKPAPKTAAPQRATVSQAEIERAKREAAKRPARTPARRGQQQQRRGGGKLTISEALTNEGRQERSRSLAAVRRERERERRRTALNESGEPRKVVRDVVVPESISVQELANRMAERGVDVVRTLMGMGVMATVNQTIDADTAELVVSEFGHKIKRVSAADVEIGVRGETDEDDANLQPRPPVVTVMGHVDHGKTSLLDAIRESDVVSGEAGGITQHIGAYQVVTAEGNRIAFIDTPGHEAFTSMRSRGAKVTDIVILVVAADDGVMPQTIEAINHAKAAEVPIIVAINKMDRPDANPNRVKQELLQHEVIPEDMGGDVQCVEVSATQKTNLDKLEEAIVLQSELLELKANPDREAQGVIIEAKLERGRGPVGTVLVQRGTLRVGDVFVAGAEWGKVRALLDSRGQQVEEAGPSVPVEVLGMNGAPQAGDEFSVVDSEARAREVADYRGEVDRDRRAAAGGRSSLEQMFSQIQSGEQKVVPLVVKADVQGSLEAIIGAAEKLHTDEVATRVLHGGVGGINESDVTLAAASDAVIIGFNVRANAQARELARRDNVEIRYYAIIYELVDDLKAAMSGLLSPLVKENLLGNAEIREVFSITKVGKVAGCMVTNGLVRRNARVRLLRDNVVIHDGGLLKTLKRFKEDVREVKEGTECGIALENYQDIQVGDVLEVFELEEVQREL